MVLWTEEEGSGSQSAVVEDPAGSLGSARVDEDAAEISGKLGQRNSGASDICVLFLFENSQSISRRRCRASSRA